MKSIVVISFVLLVVSTLVAIVKSSNPMASNGIKVQQRNPDSSQGSNSRIMFMNNENGDDDDDDDDGDDDDGFFGSRQDVAPYRDLDHHINSLFGIPSLVGPYGPMVPPSFGAHPSFMEQMMKSIHEQRERIRQDMEKIPAGTQTTEEVITGPGGRKFVRQCTNTRRQSGSSIMSSTVCKLVPADNNDATTLADDEQAVKPNQPNQPDQQQPGQNGPDNLVTPLEAPHKGDDTNSINNQGSSGGQNELKRKDMNDGTISSETIEVPTSNSR